jgi:hypothetical protein
VTAKPPVRLRGHHLICLQFYRGEGYSAEFVENLDHVLERAVAEPVLVIEGADNVCAACPDLGPDSCCASESAGGEEEIARLDELARGVLDIATGEMISLAEARERLESDAVGVGVWRAGACDGCGWESICDVGWNTMLGDAERAARATERTEPRESR